MLIHGYCEKCRRIKRVRASGNALAMSVARGGVVTGICPSCEEAERKERESRRGRRL